MNQAVLIEREGDVQVVVIGNLPVNAGLADVRRGLLGAIQPRSIKRSDTRRSVTRSSAFGTGW
ncbi:hypothetical protein [Azohydromonas aeria]|uniref:hypothetical protein n=1 Tax=Azohydromonas aeria TaxID=2590212 RepID=UPI0012F801E1|nr:hypothetical protein [Azohydromonas aeria]